MIDIPELVELKQKLDVASDELNKKIVQLEEDLKTLGLGVEAWVITVAQSENNERIRIGYRRFEGEWRIIIEIGTIGFADTYRTYHLVRASRKLRLHGYKKMHLLLPALKDEAESLLKRINKAMESESNDEGNELDG